MGKEHKEYPGLEIRSFSRGRRAELGSGVKEILIELGNIKGDWVNKVKAMKFYQIEKKKIKLEGSAS